MEHLACLVHNAMLQLSFLLIEQVNSFFISKDQIRGRQWYLVNLSLLIEPLIIELQTAQSRGFLAVEHIIVIEQHAARHG
ncbi:hypothetical protein D1872_264370 [compost metagenome]